MLSRPIAFAAAQASQATTIGIVENTDVAEALANMTPQVPVTGVSASAIAKSWARRALDVYNADVWKQDRDDEVDIADAIARLSVKPNPARAVTYYAPYGMAMSASPLAGTNPAFSEMRVWLSKMAPSAWLQDVPADGDTLTFRMRAVRPTTASSPARRRRRSTFTLTSSRSMARGSTCRALSTMPAAPAVNELGVVSESVGAITNVLRTTNDSAERIRFRHHDKLDLTRRLMFSAERLWQALTFSVGHGASAVIIRADGANNNVVLVSALSLALGMLANVSDTCQVS